jgi:ABC-type transport system involved in multi-copper enzyme maturation permease subunit
MKNKRGIGWRIIGAIWTKDVVDAIRNKTIQGVMLGILTMMLTGRMLPMLSGLSDDKTLIVYDAGKSRTILQLRKQDHVRLGRVASLAEMEEALGTAPDVYLGLVLPADFDQALAEGRAPELTAYAVHWAKQDEVDELSVFFEGVLSQVGGQPVRIRVAPERVYPPADGEGFSSLATSVLVLTTLTVGMFLVPYLIGDERQAQTMNALLVSPARIGQIVTGKVLAGAVYCLVTAAIAIAFNANLFVHWGVVVATVLCATFFAVGVGLLLGSTFELPQQMNAVAGVLLAVLMVPVVVVGRLVLPPVWQTLLAYVPSASLNAALVMSLARDVPPVALWARLGSVLVLSAAIYAATIWQIRRSDR